MHNLQVIYKPFEITGFAISLLLVFRTDASYSRYQSARHNWKRIITHIREIMRLVRGFAYLFLCEAWMSFLLRS